MLALLFRHGWNSLSQVQQMFPWKMLVTGRWQGSRHRAQWGAPGSHPLPAGHQPAPLFGRSGWMLSKGWGQLWG